MAELIQNIYKDTYRIQEVGCAGAVNMFLLTGKTRAVLIDCGYGGIDLPAIIRTVTDLPVTVICTHGHIDHAFGSWMFEDVYLHPDDIEVYKEHGSRSMQEKSWARTDMRMLKFYKIPEETFAAQRKRAVSHEPGSVKMLEDAQRFDLGGRTLQVLHMPGHTKGSVLVYDVENKVLFGGDNLNGQVWMSLPESVPMEEYGRELKKIEDFVKREGIETLYCGHEPKAVNCQKRVSRLELCAKKALSRKNPGKIVDRGFTSGYVVHSGFTSILYK